MRIAVAFSFFLLFTGARCDKKKVQATFQVNFYLKSPLLLGSPRVNVGQGSAIQSRWILSQKAYFSPITDVSEWSVIGGETVLDANPTPNQIRTIELYEILGDFALIRLNEPFDPADVVSVNLGYTDIKRLKDKTVRVYAWVAKHLSDSDSDSDSDSSETKHLVQNDLQAHIVEVNGQEELVVDTEVEYMGSGVIYRDDVVAILGWEASVKKPEILIVTRAIYNSIGSIMSRYDGYGKTFTTN